MTRIIPRNSAKAQFVLIYEIHINLCGKSTKSAISSELKEKNTLHLIDLRGVVNALNSGMCYLDRLKVAIAGIVLCYEQSFEQLY